MSTADDILKVLPRHIQGNPIQIAICDYPDEDMHYYAALENTEYEFYGPTLFDALSRLLQAIKENNLLK